MIKHSSNQVCPGGSNPAFGLLFRHLPCLLQVFTQLTTLGQFHDDHLTGVLRCLCATGFFFKYNSLRKAYRTPLYTLAKHVNSYCCQVKYLQPSVNTRYQINPNYIYLHVYIGVCLCVCVCEIQAVNNLDLIKHRNNMDHLYTWYPGTPSNFFWFFLTGSNSRISRVPESRFLFVFLVSVQVQLKSIMKPVSCCLLVFSKLLLVF